MEQNNSNVVAPVPQPVVQPQPVQAFQQPAPVVVPTQRNTHILDSIGFILMYISLYFTASAIGMTLHYYASRMFMGSDSADSAWESIGALLGSGGADYVSPVVYYSAALIVAFPVFAVLFLIMNKRTMENPEVRLLKSRRNLLYFTLVVTFIFMIYKIISLVFHLLTANINMDFFSHFLITVGICALIFSYCALQALGDHKQNV